MRFRLRLLPVAVLALVVCLAPAHAQRDPWRQHLDQGRVLDARGQYAAAMEEFRAALESAGAPQPDPARMALAHNSMGGVYTHLGQRPEAEKCYREAARLLERAQGSQSPYLAMVLNNLSDALLARGEPGQAERVLRRALAILDSQVPATDSTRAPVLQGLGRLATLRGDYQEARSLLDRALELQLARPRSADTKAIQVREDLVEVARLEGNHQLQATLAEQVVREYEMVLGPKHPDLANACNSLALAYWALGRKGEAREVMARAYEIATASLSEDHPLYATVLLNYSGLMKGIEDRKRLKTLAARAKALMLQVQQRDQSGTIDLGDFAYRARK